MAVAGLIWLWQNPAAIPAAWSIPGPGFPGLGPHGEKPARQAQIINNLLAGRINAVLDVSLATDATSSTITDPRLGAGSYFWFTPLSLAAAIELGRKTMYVASRGKQTATIAHSANTAPRPFRALVLG